MGSVSAPPAARPVEDLFEGLDSDAVGARMHGLIADLYPICRSITGDGVRATLRRIGDEIPLEIAEVPSGTRCARLDGPPRVEHTRRLREGRGRKARHRLQRVEPARDELQRPGPATGEPRRAPRASPLDPGASGLDPVQDVLLRRELGVLRERAPAREPHRPRVRGRDRFDARGRRPDVRRMRPRGRVHGRGPDLVPRLPSVAGQRQPLRDRGRDRPRGSAPGGATPSHLPVPVHPRHDRLDHLARQERAGAVRDQARAGPDLRRRRGLGDLQAEPARATPTSTERSRRS